MSHSASRPPAAAAAASTHHETLVAAGQVASQLGEHLVDGCDLLILFATFHHRAALPDAAAMMRATLDARCVLGTTAESVLANGVEIEGRGGISAMALRVPGLEVRSFLLGPAEGSLLTGSDAPRRLREHMHVGLRHRLSLLLADPFSTPTAALLQLLGPHEGLPAAPVAGGLSSGASQPGCNVLVADEVSVTTGAVGVSLAGDLRVDTMVSQGCRPIGQPMVVTRSEGNVIKELGGRPAIAAAQEMADRLSPQEKNLVGNGLLLGLAVDEYKSRFGRGDFLVRGVLGGDRESGAIAVGDVPRVGQTVQFHVRDRATADEDLRLLLDAEQLDVAPLATLLFTCNSRGRKLFEGPHHDARLLHERLGRTPVAGFFAAGEIGLVGGRPFLHGHTAVATLLRVG
jgi:small ligand-binding sensory domain FIST